MEVLQIDPADQLFIDTDISDCRWDRFFGDDFKKNVSLL